MSFMWADTLLAAEGAHLLRILLWGAASLLVGTGLLAWLRLGARRSALLEQFAIQTAAWGTAELALAGLARASLAMRDLTAATRLDRLLWLNLGLDAGYAMLGLALAVVGWRLARHLGYVGAGIAIIVQGGALALLDLTFALQISR
ncbi:MAG TPA: hypothetical protein VFY85_07945 [Gemmatimonadaceae bacterium]|nr:hypothetical protein [Gemmatimonadaceae bacterium]